MCEVSEVTLCKFDAMSMLPKRKSFVLLHRQTHLVRLIPHGAKIPRSIDGSASETQQSAWCQPADHALN